MAIVEADVGDERARHKDTERNGAERGRGSEEGAEGEYSKWFKIYEHKAAMRSLAEYHMLGAGSV